MNVLRRKLGHDKKSYVYVFTTAKWPKTIHRAPLELMQSWSQKNVAVSHYRVAEFEASLDCFALPNRIDSLCIIHWDTKTDCQVDELTVLQQLQPKVSSPQSSSKCTRAPGSASDGTDEVATADGTNHHPMLMPDLEATQQCADDVDLDDYLLLNLIQRDAARPRVIVPECYENSRGDGVKWIWNWARLLLVNDQALHAAVYYLVCLLTHLEATDDEYPSFALACLSLAIKTFSVIHPSLRSISVDVLSPLDGSYRKALLRKELDVLRMLDYRMHPLTLEEALSTLLRIIRAPADVVTAAMSIARESLWHSDIQTCSPCALAVFIAHRVYCWKGIRVPLLWPYVDNLSGSKLREAAEVAEVVFEDSETLPDEWSFIPMELDLDDLGCFAATATLSDVRLTSH